MKWLVGVALVLLGLTLGTTGMQLIRMSELKKKDGHEKECKIYYICGMLMNIILGPLLDVAGYAFAPAALIAPFTGFNIIINSVVAPYTLGEELTPRRCFSASIVFIAATSSIAFKQTKEESWTLEHAQNVLLQWRVLLYGIAFAVWFLFNVFLRARAPHGSVIRGFSLGATAGSLAGNMWCTRVAAVFAGDCLKNHECAAWHNWISWLILGGAIFFAVANVPYMAKGMRKYEALFMVTIFQGSNILSNSLSALVVLQEMDGEPWWKLAGYFICILFMMFGISILVLGETACPKEEVEVDLRRMISIEEGLEDAESSESEPEMIDFIHAVAKDPYTHELDIECMAGDSDHTDHSESS